MAPSHAIPKLEPAPPGGSHRRRLAPWIILAALFLLTYAWTFRDLVSGWISRDRLVLGLVVLAGAAFLAWDRREDVARAPVKPSRWGLALIVLSLLLLFVGTRVGLASLGGMTSVFLRGVSVVAFLCGAVLLLYGWGAMMPLWLPALLLLFMYPENYLTSYWVPLRLQTLAAVICENVIALLGIAVVREGHVLETAGFSANVQEACSGIRSLMTVVPTAIFISAYGLHRPGPRAALVLLAVPVTILANVVRVTVTVLVGIYIGKAAAVGFFHYFAGLGIFILCLAGLLLLLRVLRLLEPGPASVEEVNSGTPSRGASGFSRRASWPPLLDSRVLALAGFLVIGSLYQGLEAYTVDAAARKYPDAPLAGIRRRIGKWVAQDLEIDEATVRARKPTEWLYREYRAPGQPPIQVLVLYWKPGSGTFRERREHGAEACAQYHGLKQEWTETAEVPTKSALLPTVLLRSSVFSHASGSILVTSIQQIGLTRTTYVSGSYLDRLAFRARGVLSGRELHSCMLVFQFVTDVGASVDRIASAHERFASWFVGEAVDIVMGSGAQSD